MDIGQESVALLFAMAAFVIGGYGIFKRTITFSVGESDPETDREITGNAAKIASGAMILAGCAVLIDFRFGAVLLLAALALTWLLSR